MTTYRINTVNQGSVQQDIVGGRLDLVSSTSIKYGFLNSNQLRLWNPNTSSWVIVSTASEPTIANTATDLNGTALVPNAIYDVFAEYSSATAFNLVLSRWSQGGDGANNSGTTNYVPLLTEDSNSPSPFIVTTTSNQSTSWKGYKAFNQSVVDPTGNCWMSGAWPSSGSPQSLMIDMGQSVCINKYAIQSMGATNDAQARRFPNAFKLQGSNASVTVSSDTGWVDLDSRSGITDPGASVWSPYWTFVNNQSYRYYRLRITAAISSYADAVVVGELKLVASTTSLPGSSSRVAAYESTVTYAIGDRVTYGGHDWVCIQSGTGHTPAAGAYWVDNGTSVSGDFAGLYRHDGVLVSSSSTTGKSRRWLGIIYTYNNGGTVNFKDDVNYRFVSNFYNRKDKSVVAISPNVGAVSLSPSADYAEFTTVTRGYFISCRKLKDSPGSFAMWANAGSGGTYNATFFMNTPTWERFAIYTGNTVVGPLAVSGYIETVPSGLNYIGISHKAGVATATIQCWVAATRAMLQIQG